MTLKRSHLNSIRDRRFHSFCDTNPPRRQTRKPTAICCLFPIRSIHEPHFLVIAGIPFASARYLTSAWANEWGIAMRSVIGRLLSTFCVIILGVQLVALHFGSQDATILPSPVTENSDVGANGLPPADSVTGQNAPFDHERAEKERLAREAGIEARRRASAHLDLVDRRCEELRREGVEQLDRYFRDMKKQTPEFAEIALSWTSKWKLSCDFVPFTSKDRHRRFMEQAFREHLFSKEGVESKLTEIVRAHLQEIKGLEDEMLIKIRIDLNDLPEFTPLKQSDTKEMQTIFAKAMDQTIGGAEGSLRDEIAKVIVSEMVGAIVARVVARLGVSGAVLGTGAATSWNTLGISLVIAVVVDQVISTVWDWYADPMGELVRSLDEQIDALHSGLVDGTGGQPGLRQSLSNLDRRRGQERREAITKLLHPGR